jgi:WD40 repeat protein
MTVPSRLSSSHLAADRVLTGSDDTTARLWEAATGKTVATLEGRRPFSAEFRLAW